MPILMTVLILLAGIPFWTIRAKNAAAAAGELVNAANDVRLAARRFGFRHRANQHPADAVDDPHLAVAALGTAFLTLDALPAHEQRIALSRALQREIKIPLDQSDELMVLGQWLVTECGSAQAAISRLARRLYKINGGASFSHLVAVVQDVAATGRGGLTEHQREALSEFKRSFRLR